MITLDRKTFDDAMNWLVKFHGAELSDVARSQYYKTFLHIEDTEFSAIVNRWCEVTTPQKHKFPAPLDLQKTLFEIRDAKRQREKSNEPGYEDFERAAGRTEHGRESIALMRDLSEGRKSRGEYLAGMYAMDKKYPGVGWKQNADELKAFWDSEPARHAVGARYLERVWKSTDEEKEQAREKLKRQAEWLKQHFAA